MISIIIPVYNNIATLAELADKIHQTLAAAYSYEVIFIDDGSKDNSLTLLRTLAQKNDALKILALSRNFGQHAAISAGFEYALGDKIVLMDADLQDDPAYIPELIARLKDNIDVVYTVKAPGTDKDNKVSSNIFHYFFGKLIQRKSLKNIGTYRAFTRKFLCALLQYPERNIVYGPLMQYMGFENDVLQVVHQRRKIGKSSYTLSKRLKLSIDALMSYTNIPHLSFIWFGLSLFTGSLIYGIYIVTTYLLYGRVLLSGITLILVVLLLTLGSLMISLGIMGNYIFRIFQEVLHRPRYLVKEFININNKKMTPQNAKHNHETLLIE
jgi:polyisoprenyl-phosphate glycosyltransferase